MVYGVNNSYSVNPYQAYLTEQYMQPQTSAATAYPQPSSLPAAMMVKESQPSFFSKVGGYFKRLGMALIGRSPKKSLENNMPIRAQQQDPIANAPSVAGDPRLAGWPDPNVEGSQLIDPNDMMTSTEQEFFIPDTEYNNNSTIAQGNLNQSNYNQQTQEFKELLQEMQEQQLQQQAMLATIRQNPYGMNGGMMMGMFDPFMQMQNPYLSQNS